MDIVVNVNIDTAGETPKVEVKKPLATKQNKKHNLGGGVLQFPAKSESNTVLDMLGIQET